MRIHIDMSEKLYKRKTIGIAWTNDDRSRHQGMALSKQSIEKLIYKVQADHDFARIYAICIFFLIKDYPEKISELVICNDEPFNDVKEYLLLLLSDFSNFSELVINSISQHRENVSATEKIRSLADGLSKSYRKRALHPSKWDRGKKLNVVKVTCEDIFKYWEKINQKL